MARFKEEGMKSSGKFRVLLGAGLLMLAALLPASAQRGPGHGGRRPPGPGMPWPPQGTPGQGQHYDAIPDQAHPKAGDWLRQYQKLSPAEQQKMLADDPNFKSLPPEKQARLRKRLEQFNSLPPEERHRLLDRLTRFEEMTPEQRQRWQAIHQTLHQMPDERRDKVRAAFRYLRQLPPEERKRQLSSERITSAFSAPERELLGGMLENDMHHASPPPGPPPQGPPPDDLF